MFLTLSLLIFLIVNFSYDFVSAEFFISRGGSGELFGESQKTTENYIRGEFFQLPSVFRCEQLRESEGVESDFTNVNSVGDLLIPFSDLYLTKRSDSIDILEKLLNERNNFNIPSDATGTGHRTVTTSGFLSPNRDLDSLWAFPRTLPGEENYSIVLDTCQDGVFNKNDNDDIVVDLFSVKPIALETIPDLTKIKEIKVKADKLAKEILTKSKWTQVLLAYIIEKGLENVKEPLGKLLPVVKYSFNTFSEATKLADINYYRHYLRIANDPPNFNYDNFSLLRFNNTYQSIPDFAKSSILSSSSYHFDNLISSFNNQISLGNVFLDSIEKYDGAMLEDDPYWSAIHGNQLDKNSNLLINEIDITINNLKSVKNDIQNDSLLDKSTFENTQSIFNRIAKTGFNHTEINIFKNLGIADLQINQTRQFFIDNAVDNFTFEDFINLFDKLILLHNEFKQGLNELNLEIDSNINKIVNDNKEIVDYSSIPIADSGGPYFGNVNTVIQLDGSLSQNKSKQNITKYEWDLNTDGVFNDFIGPNATFVSPISMKGYVGLKITDKGGKTGIDYSTINITNPNFGPIFDSFQPSNLSLIMRHDETMPFFISFSDLEDDDIEIQWFLDNTLMPNANRTNFLFDPKLNEIGLHTITASIYDQTHFGPQATNQSWIVDVLADDLDLDGWTINVDCNDHDSTINPDRTEIHYNGIDDDCNLLTVDENLPPIAFNQTISVLQNSANDIILSTADNDNDILNATIVSSPQNGTLENIHTDQSSGQIIATYTPKPNFHGLDSFTFVANDLFADSNIATVNINIGMLESPIVQDRQIIINEDTPTEIELKGISPDGHPLIFSLEGQSVTRLAGQPTVGTIKDFKVTSPYTANITYIPPKDFSRDLFGFDDGINFRVSDGSPVPGFEGRESSASTITINVNGINDAPQPFNKIVSTVKETPINITLRSIDAENDHALGSKLNKNLTFGIYSPPAHGTLGSIVTKYHPSSIPSFNITEDMVTYIPDIGFTGEDSFRFFASDGISQGIGNVTINVKPTNSTYEEFEDGDIFLSTLGAGIHWYKPDGTFVKILPPAPNTAFGDVINVGGAFDSLGNLYVAEFNSLSFYDGTAISKYNKHGELIDTWRDNFGCLEIGSSFQDTRCLLPESITIDKDDNVYVGGVATLGGSLNNEPQNEDNRDDIRKFDSNGTFITEFNPIVENRGSDWVELAPDLCTLLYTSEGRHIKQFNVCNDTQMKDFGDAYGVGRSGEDQGSRSGNFPNYALRILPDRDVLVASESKIVRLNSEGNIIQTYDIPNEDPLFALNIDPDGKSFWTSSIGSHDIYKVDIQSGRIVQHFKTSLDAVLNGIPVEGSISGIMIKGEPTLSTTEFAPIVFNQTGIINENVPTLINLTGFDIANDPLIFKILEGTNSGTLGSVNRINNNISQISYTPNADFDGTDSFTFNANDGKLDSTNTGTITITRNHAPIANDDRGITTLQGIPLNISVLDNDTDIDIGNQIIDDNIRISNIDTSETLGNVTLNNDNMTINYVPFVPEYIGPDSFNYTITDRYGMNDTARVDINVLSSNNVPVANNQTIETMENTAKTVQLIAIDVDPNDKLFYQIVGGPSNGFISTFNSTTGIAEYHPLKAFHGEDSFAFAVHDGKDKSLPAFVNITVIDDNINDPPIVESERISANVSQQVAVDVLHNDIDPNGDFLTLTNFTGPFNGTAIVNQDQTITYQSDPNFNNSDVLYYRVSDTAGAFDIGQLIIDVQGNADTQIIQVPSDRLVTTTINQPVDIELEATATIDRPLSFFIVDAPENGTLGDITSLSNSISSIRYTPNSNFQGNDSFTYVARDDNGVTSNLGTIQISVDNTPNNPPIAQDIQITLDEDKSYQIQLDAFDIDLTDSLTYSIETQPFSGNIFNFDPLTGSLVYQPNSNFNGNDSFLYKASDQHGVESNIATVHITVNPVNDPPVANNQQVETNQNAPIQITLSGTDPLDNGDTISQFRIINNPTNGQITDFNQNTGILTYTPNNLFFGTDSFIFKVVDNNGAESVNSATVSIKVNEIILPNIAPRALDKSVETFKNTPLGIQLQGIDFDQGDTIESFSIVNNPTNGQVSNFNSGIGTLTYTPNINYLGSDSFTFKVTDNHGLESTNTGLVTINVKATEEPPNNEQPPLPLPSSVCIGSDSKQKPKGTQGNDELVGTSQRDTINGLGGNDRFNGCSGDDTLNGNSGNDGIAGGLGDDKLHGNEGNDYLQGDSGDDSLFGNEGNDILVGNEGRDEFFCGNGQDKIVDFNSQLDTKSNDCEVF